MPYLDHGRSRGSDEWTKVTLRLTPPPAGLVGAGSAIHHDYLPGNVARFVGCEEQRAISSVFGMRKTPQRNIVRRHSSSLRGNAALPGRINEKPWRNRITANAVRAVLHRDLL